MKNIKRFSILLITILTFISVGALSVPAVSEAQTQQKLLLVATPYQPLQNLDFFFTHSVYKIAYYEEQNTNTPVKTPVFLSIITPAQMEEYLKAGYKPVIVDENAGEITQYYELFSRVPNQSYLITNPEFNKLGLELVYPVTEYAALIKLAPGITYRNLDIPGLHKFQPRMFSMDIVLPDDRISADLRTTGAIPVPLIDEENPLDNPLAFLIFISAVSFISYIVIKGHNRKD